MHRFELIYIRLVILTLILTALPGANASADQNKSIPNVAMLNLTVGQVGIADDINEPLRFGVEYRFSSFSKWSIIPALGYARASNGASYLYSDLRLDIWLNNRWLLIPSFGLGAFDDSDEIQLGNKLEFRSGVELAYRFYKQYRIGLAVFHLSNGGLSDQNPGTEALVVSLCIPLSN